MRLGVGVGTALEAVEGEGIVWEEGVVWESGMAEVRDKRIRARVTRHQPSLRMV